MRSLLAIASIFATAFAAKEIAFSGSIGSVKGFDVSVKTGSKCVVEYQDQTKLGANCTVLVDVAKPGTTDKFEFSLSGGVSLLNNNDVNLVAQVNYAATLPNPLTKSVIKLPKEGTGVISYNLPKLPSQVHNVCATDILDKIPSASTQIAENLLKMSGSDGCIDLNVTTNGNTGASVRIIVSLDLLNADLITDNNAKLAFNILLGQLGVSKIEKDIDVGKTIVKLIRQIEANGKISTSGRVLRALSSSSDSSSDVVSDDGVFMLGSANPNSNNAGSANLNNSNNAALYVGVSIASVAVVAIVAGAFIVFRRRTAATRV
jgi:hypothetical protein